MVILTGADGFLGSFVLKELRLRNYEVLAAVHKLKPHLQNTRGLHWVEVELADAASISNLPEAEGGVIHLACSLSQDQKVVLNTDVAGIDSLLETWNGGPFIYISSTDVYGLGESGTIMENSNPAPNNWYGSGKVICEERVRMEANGRLREDFTIFRPPFILGKHDRFEGSAIGQIIKHCLQNQDFIFPVSAKPTYAHAGHSWVSAKNLAKWIVDALENRLYGTFNAVNDYIRWKQLIEMVIQKTRSKSTVRFEINGRNTALPIDSVKNISNHNILEMDTIQLESLDEILDELIK